MIATLFFPASTGAAVADTAEDKPPRRSTPVFIGDAVQPLGRDTLLLEIFRQDDLRDAGQS